MFRSLNINLADGPALNVPQHLQSGIFYFFLDEFLTLITEVPPWASGLPVKAEGWRGRRYRK